MNCHTKFARLSQPAMILQHGRLLQDSGFTRQDSTPLPSNDWVRTTMSRLAGSSFQYTGTVRSGRLSSGRPAIQNIPRQAELSTSLHQFREIASMYSIEELRDAMRSALQKIYSQPLRSESQVLLMAMPLWERLYPNTPLPAYCKPRPASIYGLTRTGPERTHAFLSQSNLSWLDLSRFESPPTKTPRHTA